MTSSPEREFVSAHLDDLHADLDAWVRIPSIPADPAHADDVAASAARLAEALEELLAEPVRRRNALPAARTAR